MRTAYGIKLKTGEITYFTDAGHVIKVTAETIGGKGKNIVTSRSGKDYTLLDWSPRAQEVWSRIKRRDHP